MFGFITQQARSVSAPRREHVAVDAFRNAPRSNMGARHALGVALVALGERVAGEMAAAQARQPERDCI
jgi:hypothetical protein